MAISDQVKADVMARKAQLRSRFMANKALIDEYVATIEKLQDENAQLKATYEAYDADIPEPVSAEPL